MEQYSCPADVGHDKVKGQEPKTGYLGIPEAPVYYPTVDEFKDPYAYIERIRQEAEAYGICRIVPPEQWKPPFAINRKTFTFPTKLQAIHHLQMRPAARDADTFKLEYTRFLEKEGRKVGSWPSFRGKELDLCQFFGAVKRHGGYQKVSKEKKWGDVLQILDPACMLTTHSVSLQSSLRDLYEAHLYDYEVYLGKSIGNKRHRNMVDHEAKNIHGGRKFRKVSANEDEKVVVAADKKTDQICEQCQGGAHEESMLLCDRCDRGWHTYCLTPPLSAVPPGNWYCFDCLTSEKESFGFTTGQFHNFDSFRQAAKRFKKKWFGGRKDVTAAEIEEEFWSVVERLKGPVEVLYGSDLASEVYGSGFPRSLDGIPITADKALWKEYAASPWNLNNITKLEGSVLKHVQENIPGVTVPWVYMGMLFSSFCWHYEDQCFYSINYLHWGEPKRWYGVPGSAIDAFEQVMHKTFPDLFEAQPDLLFQLVTMLNPRVLRENDVPVCTTLQERGNFVITFPRSYHGGFNHGLNCAEAVNFATLDWLPFGRLGVERARLYHKAAVLSQEELLCVVAKKTQSYPGSPSWLKKELKHMVSLERKQRMQLWKKGIIRSLRMPPRKDPDVIGTEEDPGCVICRYYLFMSALTCSCCPGRVVCLQHCEQLCECGKDQQQLLYRYSLGELDDLQMKSGCLDNIDAAVRELKEKQKRGRLSNVELGLRKEKDTKECHMNLAEAWCLKAKSLLQMTPKPLDVQNLIREAEQFLWAGHEMDHVREIEKNLRSAQSWAQGVVTCLASSGVKLEYEHRQAEKPLLATAQQLLSVNPAPCDLQHSVSKLKDLVSSAVEMQHQLQALFCRPDPLELGEVEVLQQKLLQSAFRYPELDQLEELVRSVHVWRDEVQTLLSEPRVQCVPGQNNGMNMDKLHKLQAEASHMAVVLPEKKDLDVYVSKLEKWQDEAKLILESAVSLQDVEEVLLEIENLPVYLREAEVLEQRVHETQEWIRSSYRVIAAVQQQSYHAASKELLSALLRSGELLKIKMKEIDYVKLEFHRVSWFERATKGLHSQLTSAELMDVVEEASSLSLQNEELYIELLQVVEEARAWEHRASQFLQDGAPLDDFKALRRDSSKIYASLLGWTGINIAITQAEAFLHHAQPFVNRDRQHPSAIMNFKLLQELINQSESFKVVLPERAVLLDICKGVSSWKEQAIDMIMHARQDLYKAKFMSQFSMEMAAEDVKSWTISSTNALLTDLRRVLDEGKALGFELPELDTLSTLVKATEWNLRVSHMLRDHPSVEELDLLVQEGKSFEGYFGELHQLQTCVSKGQEWIVKLRSILHHQEGPPPSKCSINKVEELLNDTKALGLTVFKDFSYLEQRIAFHKAWQKHMFRCLHPPKQAISWEELQQLQEIEKSSPIQFENVEVLESESLKVGLWLSKCSTKLLGWSDSSSTPLMAVLSQVQTSVEGALQRLQRRAYIEGEDFHMGERMCHLCRRHVDFMSTNLLTCENCHDRYHRSCLGLEAHQEWTQNQFVCSFCNAFTAGVLWVDEDVLSKICVTKRPTLSALEELHEAAEGIRFRLKEVELLERIIERVKSWESCLEKLVEPILLSHWDHSYSSSLLLSALKIAGTMEVRGDGKGQLALALSVNSWRMHAKSVMESPTKPSYRTVYRILKEGLAIPFLAHDRVLKELKTWETMASVWLSQAKLAMEDNGTIPVEEVHKLILEGEKLPVAFSKEIADLSSRTVLYCICRKPYDKVRAMIACDSCSEWYHFDCMNLPEPDTSDDDSSDAHHRYGSTTGEFFCPSCKGTEMTETRNLITQLEVDASNALAGDLTLNHDNCHVNEPLYNPLLWYSRGKRSRKPSVKVRADLQGRWQSHNRLFFCSSPIAKEADCGSQSTVSASGRPCRRTAGHNSRFESFVLLMDSG